MFQTLSAFFARLFKSHTVVVQPPVVVRPPVVTHVPPVVVTKPPVAKVIITHPVTKAVVVAGAATWLVVATPFIGNQEGYVNHRYVDTVGTGHPWTWCYGQTAADGLKVPSASQRFTKQECEDLLARTLENKYGPEIDRCINAKFLTPHRKAALVSFAYNLGSGAVCGTNVGRNINAGNITAGCNAMLAYTHANGRVLSALVTRRRLESAMCKRTD